MVTNKIATPHILLLADAIVKRCNKTKSPATIQRGLYINHNAYT